MPRPVFMFSTACSLGVALLAAGCSGEAASSASSSSTGSLELEVALASEVAVDEVNYAITGNAMAPMMGAVDTSAPGATASVEVFGIPTGAGYTITLSATANDGAVTCEGAMPFDVRVGERTDVYVMLRCSGEPSTGAVRADGGFNLCAQLSKVVVSSLATSTGNRIDLAAKAADQDGDTVAYRWTATGGTVTHDTAAETTYACEVAGAQQITIAVSDDDFTDCEDSWTVQVACAGSDGGFPCTEQGIREAIALGGGPHRFACAGPTTIVTEDTLDIDNDAILDGEGNLIVDGAASHTVFTVEQGVTAELRGLTVTNGFADVAVQEGGDGAAGGIANAGTMTLTQSTVSGNGSASSLYPGGIFNTGTMTVAESTVSDNQGSGITIEFGDLTLTNSTVSGDAISLWDGTLTITNSTISGALRGGSPFFPLVGDYRVVVANTLVEGGCSFERLGLLRFHYVASLGYNVESPGDTCFFDMSTDRVDVGAAALGLGPLADNGGASMTHALLPGSVAIDAVRASMCGSETDQRGEPRPSGTMCDVGAFEVQSQCQGAEDCDDDNECTENSCTEGSCVNTALPDGTACSEGVCLDRVCAPEGAFSCTEQGIREAIAAGGGPHVFACDGPTRVITKAELLIDRNVSLDGGDDLVVDGSNEHRVFAVSSGVAAELTQLTITHGVTGIDSEGALALADSTISYNQGHGIRSSGTLTVSGSTVTRNEAEFSRGAGIQSSGDLALVESTVSYNRDATFDPRFCVPVLGGGIDISGIATLINTTVFGNEESTCGPTDGGGISALGALTLINSTVSDNVGEPAGIRMNAGTLTFTNSIMDDDCFLPDDTISTGHNIESPGDSCGLDQPTDQASVSPEALGLEPLADNGGPTETCALLPQSIAVNQIPLAVCEVATDQRGEPRPEPGGTMCDVGAFELQR